MAAFSSVGASALQVASIRATMDAAVATAAELYGAERIGAVRQRRP